MQYPRARMPQHMEFICVAYLVAEIRHRFCVMCVDQSTDALAPVGDHGRRQLKGELSSR